MNQPVLPSLGKHNLLPSFPVCILFRYTCLRASCLIESMVAKMWRLSAQGVPFAGHLILNVLPYEVEILLG